jgi:hypothetical protein
MPQLLKFLLIISLIFFVLMMKTMTAPSTRRQCSMWIRGTEWIGFIIPWLDPATGLSKHPNDIPLGANHDFKAYKDMIGVHYRLWDIQNRQHTTSYLKIDSASDPSVFSIVGGRADFIITPLTSTNADYLSTMLCVIEIQTKDEIKQTNEKLYDLQMLVYLLILMNTRHLPYLVGFLVRKDGPCRAYKATRDVETGGCIFEMNDLFHVFFFFMDVLQSILHSLAE